MTDNQKIGFFAEKMCFAPASIRMVCTFKCVVHGLISSTAFIVSFLVLVISQAVFSNFLF